MSSSSYRLSTCLAGHSQDVRSLASSSTASSSTLFSSSRDGTARSWTLSSLRPPTITTADGDSEMKMTGGGGGGWREERIFAGAHDGFVNAVAWLKPRNREDTAAGEF